MTDHDTVQRIFEQVADAPEAERDALLGRLCDGDERLRADVESLLRADERAGVFMARSVAEALGAARDLSGARFGAYQLDALLGEGADHTELARWIEQKVPGQRLE